MKKKKKLKWNKTCSYRVYLRLYWVCQKLISKYITNKKTTLIYISRRELAMN